MSLGDFRTLKNSDGSWEGQCTLVPVELLQHLSRPTPIPITIGGSNNVTFTVVASTARPVRFWHGDQMVNLTANVVYTWDATSNPILTSTGAESTDTDSVLGVWYMYFYYDTSATPPTATLIPSQTAPTPTTAGPYPGGLSHPGTAKVKDYTYVGIMECTTAATPAFRAMVKTGYWYKFAPRSIVVITDAWTAPTAATLTIPRIAGVEIGVTLETGANGQIFVGSHSASTIWDVELDISEDVASNVAAQVLQAPAQFSVNASATPFYAIAAPAGDIHIHRIKDVV